MDATDTAPSAAERQPARGLESVFGDIAALGLARVGAIGLSFVTIVLSTRILGPTEYAVFAYVAIAGTFVFIVGSAWTTTAVSRYGREAVEASGRLNAVSWERLVITAPAVLAAAGLVVVLEALDVLPNSLDWALIALALVYGVVLAGSDHGIYAMQALGHMKTSSAGILLRQALVVAGLACLLAVGRSSVLLVTGVTVCAWSIMTVIFARRVWAAALWPPAFDARLRRQLLLFSAPLMAFTFSQYVIQTIDLVIIGVFRSTTDVGLYALAYQAYTALQAVPIAIISVLTPLFVSLRAAGQDDTVRRFAERSVSQLTFLVSWIVGVFIPLVPLIVPVAFGRRFAGSSVPLEILLVAVVVLLAANLVAPILVLHEATRAVAVYNLLAAGANVAADFLLLGPLGLGLWAPAAATLGSVATITWGYGRTARRITGAPRVIRSVVFIPVAVGLAASLALNGAARPLVGCSAALLAGLVILARARLVDGSDAAFVHRVRMPRVLRRIALAGIAFSGRFG